MSDRDMGRVLLLCDLAVEAGLARADDVAGLIEQSQDPAGPSPNQLIERLVLVADLAPADLMRLQARAASLEADAGDAVAAVSARRGIARTIHTALAARAPGLSRAVSEAGAPPRTPLTRMREGRYVDFMPVGEGGMGVVFLAHDTELNREVAMKLVRLPSADGAPASADDPLSLRAPAEGSTLQSMFEGHSARFLHEACVTGSLEHPGVAPIHEIGSTEAGVPYYTMRYIRGSRTLADAIREATGGPLEQRLALLEPFLHICDAVAFAHARGVVHRDLKPANVAIGEYGEVVVLDWGLAGLDDAVRTHTSGADAQLLERLSTQRTQHDLETVAPALGTPGYMAPEALAPESGAIDALSDVYSLGVILFEMLSGRLPHPPHDFRAYIDLLRSADAPALRECAPDTPAALASLCDRALARERDARPPSVATLAGEIRAWQARSQVEREIEGWLGEGRRALDEVAALPPEAAVARLDAVVAACALIERARPGHAEGAHLLAEATRLREAATSKRERLARRRILTRVAAIVLVLATSAAVAVAGVLKDKNADLEIARTAANEARGRAETAQEHAEAARERAVLEREEAEKVVRVLLFDLRDKLQAAGRLDLLRLVADKVVAYYEQMPDEDLHPDTLRRRAVALLNAGSVMTRLGALTEAEGLTRRGIAIVERLQTEHATDNRLEAQQVEARLMLGDIEAERGERWDAIEHYRDALTRQRALHAKAPSDAAGVMVLAEALRKVSISEKGDGHWVKALEGLEEAIRLLDAFEPKPDDADALQSARADTLVALGDLHESARRYADGIAVLERALEIGEERLRAAPSDVTRQTRVAEICSSLATTLRAEKEYARAEELAQREITIRQGQLGREPDNPVFQSDLASAYMGAGFTARVMGDLKAAALWARKAHARRAHLLERNPKHVSWMRAMVHTLRSQARLHDVQLEPGKSFPLWQRAKTLLDSIENVTYPALEAEVARSLEVAELGALDQEGLPEGVRLRAFGQRCFARGRAAVRRGEHAVALAEFRQSFDSPELRADLAGETLFVAARAAAHASTLRPGPEGERRARLALAWLGEDLRRRAEAGDTDGVEAHRQALRADEVFAPLRDRPAFRALLR